MGTLTVVGIGPGDPELLTRKAERILHESQKLILRTAEHGVAEYLDECGIAFTTLDHLYDEAEDFDEIEALSASAVRDALRQGDVTYAVPGQGMLSDGTVQKLLAMRIRVEIIPGVSQADDALARGGKLTAQSADGLMQLPASLVQEGLLFSRVPLLVTELDDPLQAGEAKLALQQVYGEDAEGILITAKGAKKLPLEELDRQRRLDHTSCYYLSGADASARYDFSDLTDLMEILRRQCPWDREQTHESLRHYLLEECAEVLDAMDRDDPQDLCEELGDLLYQVVFHASIAASYGDFDIRDVTNAICRKMHGRHPAIFGAGTGRAEDDWEEIKAKEHGYSSPAEQMAAVPGTLPALMRAQKLLRYAGAGLDEAQARAALEAAIRDGADPGECLMACVQWLAIRGADAELSLRDACARLTEQAQTGKNS